MRLHDRYLMRELITPLAFCLGGFMVLGLSFFFTKQLEIIQDKKLNLGEIAAYCSAGMLEFFVLIMPLLLLLALLYALTNHARHNEITALRAAGVSLWRICLPYFTVGLLATIVYFALNEFAVPNCERWAGEILTRHVKPVAKADPKAPTARHSFTISPENRSWVFNGDYDVVNNAIPNPTVQWSLPDGSLRILRADRAVYTNNVWTFYNAQIFMSFGAHGALEQSRITNSLAVPKFEETPEKIRLLLKFSDSQTLHATSSADIPLAELWEYLRNSPSLRPDDARALQTKFYGRIATPFTCFVVVLIAIPFGAQTGRRNMFFGVAGSIFIGLTFIVLQRVSLALGMNGQLPGWLAAWLPNLAFAGMGIISIWRAR